MGIASQFKIGGVPGGVRQLLNIQTLAATGSDETDAAQITTKGPCLVYATDANGTKGIKLPKAVPGKYYTIKNRDSDNGILKVYPYEDTTQINAVTAGDPLSMAAKTAACFVCVNASLWITVPLLPS